MRTLYNPSLAGFLAVGFPKTLLCALAIGAGLTVIAPSQAAMMAFDNASDPAYATWDPGDNGGTGWGGGWTFRNQSNAIMLSTNGNRGWFRGSSINNNSGGVDSNGDGDINSAGNNAWGVYSNSTDEVYAIRPLSGAMNVGDKFSFDMDNGNINGGQVVGMRFLSNPSAIGSRVTEFRFVGNDPSGNYTIIASPSNQTTTIGFSREGLHVDFTLTSASTYSMTVTRLSNGVVGTFTGSMLNGDPINAIAFKNQFAGSGSSNDGFFNNIRLTEVPEPAGAALLALAATLPRRRVVRG